MLHSLSKFIQRRTYDYLNTTFGFTIFLILCYFLLSTIISTLSSNNRLRGINEIQNHPYENIVFQDLFNELVHEPIDVVYTWVNGSDPIWKAKKDKWALIYKKKDDFSSTTNLTSVDRGNNITSSFVSNTTNNTGLHQFNNISFSNNTNINMTIDHLKEDLDDTMSVNRYRDSSELRYSLRSLIKNAPWIRHIYIVTDNQIPNWINLETSRLTIISHSQIFANKSHLPVFSSPAIEANLHRIPGLSKKFIYFNDDVFLGTRVLPEDFITRKGAQKLVMSWDVPKCAPGCSDSWIGDGYCDKACNVSSCNFDYPDCVNGTGSNHYSNGQGAGNHNNAQKFCSTGCPDSWLGDRICDLRCKNEACAWDMTDCGIDLVTLGYPSSTIIENNAIITKSITSIIDTPIEQPNIIENNIIVSNNETISINNSTDNDFDNLDIITTYVADLNVSNETIIPSIEAIVQSDIIRRDDYDDYMHSREEDTNQKDNNMKDIALTVEFGTKAVYFDLAYLPCMYYQYNDNENNTITTIENNSSSSSSTCKVDHISNTLFNYEESSHSDEERNLIQSAVVIRKHHILVATLYHGGEDSPKPYYFPMDVYFTVKGKFTPKFIAGTSNNRQIFHFEAVFTLRVIDPMDYTSFSSLESMIIPYHMNSIEETYASSSSSSYEIESNVLKYPYSVTSSPLIPSFSSYDHHHYSSQHEYDLHMMHHNEYASSSSSLYDEDKANQIVSDHSNQDVDNDSNQDIELREGIILELMISSNNASKHVDDHVQSSNRIIMTTELFIEYKITLRNSSVYTYIEPLCNSIMSFNERDLGYSYFNHRYGDDHIRYSAHSMPQSPVGFTYPYNNKYNKLSAKECPLTLASLLIQTTLDHTIYREFINRNKPKFSKRFIDNNSSSSSNDHNEEKNTLQYSLFLSVPMPIGWSDTSQKDWIHLHANVFHIVSEQSDNSSLSKNILEPKNIIINQWFSNHHTNTTNNNSLQLNLNHSFSICNTISNKDSLMCSDSRIIFQNVFTISSLYPWGRDYTHYNADFSSSSGTITDEHTNSLDKSLIDIIDNEELKLIGNSINDLDTNLLSNNISNSILHESNLTLHNDTNYNTNISIIDSNNNISSLRIRRRLDQDTYAASLIHVNRIYNKEFGTDNRKVPAHYPHMIDKDYMYEMQSKWPLEWNLTSSNRFRSPMDMQYSFSYYYYLINRHKAIVPNIYDYIKNAVDTDSDGIINNNEFNTLSSIIKGSDDPIPSEEDIDKLKTCILSSSTYGEKYLIKYHETYDYKDQTYHSLYDYINKSKIYDNPIEIISVNFTTFLQNNQKSIQLFPSISEVMNCSDVIIGINKNVNWNNYEPTHSIESDKDMVAFEMIGDDYNTTLKQLYSVRARQSKFICINDNMKNPSKELESVLNAFYESFFPIPSIFELPKGKYNPTLYLDQYEKQMKYNYMNILLQYISTIYQEQKYLLLENQSIHFLLLLSTIGLTGFILFKYVSILGSKSKSTQ